MIKHRTEQEIEGLKAVFHKFCCKNWKDPFTSKIDVLKYGVEEANILLDAIPFFHGCAADAHLDKSGILTIKSTGYAC